MVSPSCAVDHRLRGVLGQVDDLQPPVAERDAARPTRRPTPSGPRSSMVAVIRATAATSAARPSRRTSPLSPHTSEPPSLDCAVIVLAEPDAAKLASQGTLDAA